MTASPISDLNPVLMASGSKLTLVSKGKLFIFPCGTEGSGIVSSPPVWVVRSDQNLKVEMNITSLSLQCFHTF